MRKYKIILISLVLIVLSIGCVSANDLNGDIENDLADFDNQIIVQNYENGLINYENDLINDKYELGNDDLLIEDDFDTNSYSNNYSSLDSYSNNYSILDSYSNNYSTLDSYSNNYPSDFYSDNLSNDYAIKESKLNEKSLNDGLNSNQLGFNNLYLNQFNSNQKSSGIVHLITQSNYTKYFNKDGYVLTDIVSPYDTLELSGRFRGKNFIFTIPVNVLGLSNAELTNCMIKFEGVRSSYRSSVSNLRIRNSNEWCPGVFLENSSNVDVYGNDIYCTGANGNPVRVIFSNYSNIFGNKLESYFTGYMNLSWKRAGILLGDSHYNNIYSNDVTIKDSNPIYLTTYGFEKSNYNVIFNNTVRSSAISEDTGLSNPSAWAYGIHLMGDYNLALNNTIHNVYRGIDSEGSFNILVGNVIFNLTGGYFEGNDGTEGGDYGIHASYDNIVSNNTIFNSKLTGSAIYLMPNNTAKGNIIYNISGRCGLEFNYYADNCVVSGNIIDVPVSNPIYVFGRMNNLLIENNILSGVNVSSILVKKQSNSKYPTNLTIRGNLIMRQDIDCAPIDFTQVPSDANIVSYNNSIAVYNESFFNYYDESGSIRDCSDWIGLNNEKTYMDSFEYELLVYAGNFSNLNTDIVLSSSIVPLKSIGEDIISNTYREIGFDEYDCLIDTLNAIYAADTVFNDLCFVLNSSNISIDSFVFNNSNPDKNVFSIDGVKNISIENNRFYLTSISSDDSLIFMNSADGVSFINNFVLIDSMNHALAINNSNASIIRNNITINANCSAILNANQSRVLMEDNEIKTLFDDVVDNVNSTVPKSSFYIVNDTSYGLYFNDDGTFRDDFEIEFGNTLRFENITGKRFIIDIPLKITSAGNDCKLVNCFISLEGESSNSNITNLKFELEDGLEIDSDSLEFISIKDGVSNVNIINNSFSFDDDSISDSNIVLSVMRLYGSDYISHDILFENNRIDFRNSADDLDLYGLYLSNKNSLFSSKLSPSGFVIRGNEFNICSNGLIKAIHMDSIDDALLEDNIFNLSSWNDSNCSIYAMDLNKANNLTLTHNDILIKSNNTSYGLFGDNIDEIEIKSNDISLFGENLIAIELDNALNYKISENRISSNPTDSSNLTIIVNGNPYEDSNDSSSNGTGDIDGNQTDSDNNQTDSDNNQTDPNHNHSSGISLQDLIDEADVGDVIDLEGMVFNDLDTVNIDKSLTINGGVFSSKKNLKPLFNLINNGSSLTYLNITNGIYLLGNADILLMGNAKNGTDSLSIDVPEINIFGNEFLLLNDSVVAESINILKLVSSRASLAPTNGIYVGNNTIASGINPFVFEISSISNNSDVIINNGSIVSRKSTRIEFKNMTTKAFQYLIDGRIGEYFKVTLRDGDGNVLSNKTVQIGFNGNVYTRITDENGSAKLQINLAASGGHTFAISFLGDDSYNASFAVAKITVIKQTPVLTVSNKAYKASAKTKTLTAKLTTAFGSPLKSKKVSFVLNGKTYIATTNSKGIATVKVSLSTKKTYGFTVKIASDGTYNGVSKSAKLLIK